MPALSLQSLLNRNHLRTHMLPAYSACMRFQMSDACPFISQASAPATAPCLLAFSSAMLCQQQARSGQLPHSCSSSSKSASSSAEASWYCWYSLTRSFMLDSASVNSISSMPSPAQRSAA